MEVSRKTKLDVTGNKYHVFEEKSSWQVNLLGLKAQIETVSCHFICVLMADYSYIKYANYYSMCWIKWLLSVVKYIRNPDLKLFLWSMVVENSEQVPAHIQKKPACIHTQLQVPWKEYGHSPGSVLGTALALKVRQSVPQIQRFPPSLLRLVNHLVSSCGCQSPLATPVKASASPLTTLLVPRWDLQHRGATKLYALHF